MRDSFDAMEKQLQALAARRRAEVKTHEAPPHGSVAKLFPDYGFIASADGEEIYFHANSVVDGKFAQLEVGSPVRFVVAEKEGEHGPIDLRSCSRGDVVGEVGLFSGERSANADVAEDARLLRFTPNNLQRLRRRYPRIAATVLRNLNEIMAQRLSSLTDRLR